MEDSGNKCSVSRTGKEFLAKQSDCKLFKKAPTQWILWRSGQEWLCDPFRFMWNMWNVLLSRCAYRFIGMRAL